MARSDHTAASQYRLNTGAKDRRRAARRGLAVAATAAMATLKTGHTVRAGIVTLNASQTYTAPTNTTGAALNPGAPANNSGSGYVSTWNYSNSTTPVWSDGANDVPGTNATYLNASGGSTNASSNDYVVAGTSGNILTLNSPYVPTSGSTTFYGHSLNLSYANLNLNTQYYNGGGETVTYNLSSLNVSNSTLTFNDVYGSITSVLASPIAFNSSNTITSARGSYSEIETLSGLLSGNGTLTFTFTSGGTSAKTVNITNASNSYTGAVVLGSTSSAATFALTKSLGTVSSYNISTSSWTLTDGINNAINGAAVTNAGTINLANFNDSFGSLAGAGGVTLGTGTLTDGALLTSTAASASYSGNISGGGSVVKVGLGSQTFSGLSGYTGGTNVSAGRLATGVTGGFGTGTVNVSAGAGVYLSGGTLANTFILNGNSTFDTYGALRVDGPATVTGGVILAGNTQIGSYSGTGVISGVISDGGNGYGFAKTGGSGNGTIELTAANTYSGPTTVTAGTLQVANTTGSATGSGNVTVNGGTFSSGTVGTISGSLLAGTGANTFAPGGVGAIGTLTVGGLTTGSNTTITFDLGNASSGSVATNGDLFNIGAGTVSIASGTVLTFNTSTAASGVDYRLFGGAGAANLTLANFVLPTVNGETFALLPTTNAADPGYVDLSVTIQGARNLTWDNGGGTGLWNTTDANFNNGTGDVAFSSAGMDNVTFNDANNGSYNVSIPAVVTPGSTTVTTANTYAFNGSGGIGGTGPLTINGTGTLVLGTSNSFTGPTNLVSGTLDLQNALALSGSTLTSPTGTLVFDASVTANAFTLGGLSGTGALTLQNSAGTAITLTVGANGNSSTYTGTLGGTGLLVKGGSGTLTLTGVNTYSGGTNVSGGTLAVGNAAALGSTTATLTVNGGTLDLAGNAVTAGTVNLTAGTIADSAGGGSLTGSSYPLSAGTVTAVLAGAAGVNKTAAGTLTLGGADTYTGVTTVNNGTVNITGNETAASGGYAIGTSTANTTTVNFNAGSGIAVAAGKAITIGTIPGGSIVGSVNQTLNVYTTVNNAGSLSIGRSGLLEVNGGGVFNQSGSASIQPAAASGYSAYIYVNAGGTFNYLGSTPFNMSSSAGNGGGAVLTIAGTGVFNTGQAFAEGANTSSGTTGTANIALTGGGTIALTANVPVLTSTLSDAFNFTVGNGSGGVINTNGFNTALTLPITNGAALGFLDKTGAGTLALSGASTYNGGTGITAGTVLIGVSSVGTTSGALGASAGAALLGYGATTAASLLTNGAYTFANPITVYPDGGLSYTIGGNTSSASTVSGAVSALGSFTVAQPAGGTFNMTGGIATSGGNVTPTVTFAGPGNINVTGVISNASGTLSVAVTGGTTTFSAANTYSGPTTISAGTLRAGGTASFGSSAVAVSGGTLAGSGTTGTGVVTLNATGTITAGTGVTPSDTVGTLTVGTGGLVLNGGTYAVKINAATATVDPTQTGQSTGADELLITGPLSPSATPGLTVSPVELTSAGSFSSGQAYSFVIVDAEGGQNAGAFDALLTANRLTLPGGGSTYTDAQGTYSLSTAGDSTGTGGEDLLLDFTAAAAPEPTSLLLAALAAAPLALGRRRRSTVA